MKKKFCIMLISVISVLCLAFSLSACAAKVEFKVSFVVDGEIVHTINTNGNEVISMPPDPQKDDYIFDGWYWDKDVWQKPFTANSLLDAPLSSNMSVYCKWRPEHEHAYTEQVAEDKYKASGASCTQKATYYYSCECGEKGTDTFEYGELLPHTEETITGKAASCTETGLTDGKKCSVCGEVLVEQATIPVTEHTPSDWIEDSRATCTEKGSKHKECEICHETLETEAIDKLSHTEETITGKAATCTEDGLTDGKKCSVCDEVLVEQTTIPVKPHTEQTITGKAATCTEDGLTDGKKCSVCQTVLVEQQTIPAAHVPTAWQIDKQATCTEKGSKHKECTVCGNTLSTEEIALISHTETTIYGKTPTCTNSGLTNGRVCSVCGTTTAEQTVIPATGHKFSDGVCLACDAEQSPATISEVKGGRIDDLDIYMFVEHDVTEVNLLRIVTCSPKSTWKLYEDKRGQHEIATKIASGENDELNNGNNVFYIVATSANGIDVNTYTLTIYRSYAITVKYYNAGALERTDDVYTGYEYTAYTPEYRGYTFNGWLNGDEIFTNAVLWDSLVLNADKTAHSFTVSFVTDSKAQAIDSFTAAYDSEVILPASSKTGYTFNGWLDGGEISENTFVWNFIEDKEYTAKFTANEYTITYIPNGGTIESATQTVTYDSEFTLYNISRLGYTFEGYTKDNEVFTSGVWNLTNDITLNAEWEIITYTITYHFDEKTTNPESNPTTYTVEDSVIFADGIKTGYIFNGWFTENSYGNAITNIAKGTIGNKALYAKTTANEYTITYIPNGGSIESATQTVTYDSEFTLYNISRLGYTFEGYTKNDEAFTSGVWDIAEDITLNAEWEIINYTITYDLDGSTNHISNPATYTVEDSVTFYNATKTGYTFNGWYSEGSYANAVTDIAKGSIGDKVLYAKTTANEYTITYKFNNDVVKTEKVAYDQIYVVPGYKTNYNDGESEYETYKWKHNNVDYFSGSKLKIKFLNDVTFTAVTCVQGLFDCEEGQSCVIISKYMGARKEILIPDYIKLNGTYYSRIVVGKALQGNKNITSVAMGDNVVSIYGQAFKGCTGLENITLSKNITVIDDSTFESCTSLKEIFVPEGVTKIGYLAFYQCSALEKVSIPSSIQYVAYDAFKSCDVSYTYYDNAGYLGNSKNPYQVLINGRGCSTVNIHNNTTVIASGAFSYIGTDYYQANSYLKSVTIGKKVKYINYLAFLLCNNLTYITIPNSVLEIDSRAFDSCRSLTSIEIPNSVMSIGSDAFYDCSGIIQTVNGEQYVDKWIIDCDTSRTSVTLRANTVGIGDAAFRGCNGLTSITIGNSVTSIGNSAFSGCSKLTSITIPNSVTSIGYQAFYGCSSLINITIPDSVTSIGNWAFYGCSGLTSVYYKGSASDWNRISIGSYNANLTNATRYYYSECIYETNQWRYVGGGISTELTVGEWVIDVEPTCTSAGSKHAVCTVCGKTVTVELSKTAHIVDENGDCTVCHEHVGFYQVTNDATYPFAEADGILTSTNKGVNSSLADYVITAFTDVTVTFEYKVSSESGYDYLYILHNSTEKIKVSGTSNSYTTFTITLSADDTLTIRYSKDSSTNSGEDCCYIKSLTITPVGESAQ